MYSYSNKGPLGPIVLLALIMFSYQNCADVGFTRATQVKQNSVDPVPDIVPFSGNAIVMRNMSFDEGEKLILVAYPADELKPNNPRFVWLKGNSEIAETTRPEMRGAAAKLSDEGSYIVEYFDGDKNLGYAVANVKIRRVIDPPSISSHPSSKTIKTKGSVKFSVAASGTDLEYQWTKAGKSIKNAKSKSYSISNAEVKDAGDYRVVVSNSAGSVQSKVAKLKVETRTVTKSFSLGSKGCGSGYCASAIAGRCGSTSKDKADKICKHKGYDRSTRNKNAVGIRGVKYCGPSGKGCFINQNPTCNRRFTSVTCTREE